MTISSTYAQIYDKAIQIMDSDVKIQINRGLQSDDSLNATIHRMLQERKYIASKIAKNEVEDVHSAIEMLEKYNDELKKILGL